MEKGKFESAEGRKRRTPGTKSIALLLALALLAGGAVGGTLAWLLDSTDKIENTFSPSSIDVTLSETTQAYKMVPGWTIAKDPKVQISADSEDCYLFIKVEKTGGNVTIGEKTYGFDDFIAYAIAGGWQTLDVEKYPGVYYMEIEGAEKKGTEYGILGSGSYGTYTWSANQVLTKPEVTEEMMEALTAATYPKLNITAYAVQLYKSNIGKFSTAEAWAQAAAMESGS
ncbi:MAG: hypothetical protein PUG34_00360 [Eubacteriales bacterium]|nr:hypothetical protein [Eubacteriales bacterium]